MTPRASCAFLLMVLAAPLPGSTSEPAPSSPPSAIPANGVEDPAATPDQIGQSLLVLAKRMIERNDLAAAETAYVEVLNSPTSDAVTQDALLAYAELLRRQGQDTRAAAIYEKYLSTFPGAPGSPMVLMMLGRTLRDMGAFNLAQTRFYAVLNSTLAVSPENIQRYRDLAQLAKFEIAETFYQQGDYASAGKFFGRIKLLDLPPEDRARAVFRESYSFFLDGKLEQAVATLRTFLDNYPAHQSAQEARYLLCLSLRRLGRSQEALTETLALLRVAHNRSDSDREQWTYWQRRTGNQLANDFYEQADFHSALTIYQTLAELRAEPAWRWPALYQIGLCYERLRQPESAAKVYNDILAEGAAAEKTGTAPNGPAGEVRQMATWRLGQLQWSKNVDRSVHDFAAQQASAATTPTVQ